MSDKQETIADIVAEMREALVNISKYADCAAMRQHDATTQHYIEQIRKWAEAALATPPRNCDRFNTLEDALAGWREVSPDESGPFDNWLFAEAKGE